MISKFSNDAPYTNERKKTPLLVRAGIYAGAALLGRQVLRSEYVRPLVGDIVEHLAGQIPKVSQAHRFLLEGHEQYFRLLADQNLLWRTSVGALPKFSAFTGENLKAARRVFAEAAATTRSTLTDNVANATALGDMLRGMRGVVRDVGDVATEIRSPQHLSPEMQGQLRSFLSRQKIPTILSNIGYPIDSVSEPAMGVLDEMQRMVTMGKRYRGQGGGVQGVKELASWESLMTDQPAKLRDIAAALGGGELSAADANIAAHAWQNIMLTTTRQVREQAGRGDIVNKLIDAVSATMGQDVYQAAHPFSRMVQGMAGWKLATIQDVAEGPGLKAFNIPDLVGFFGKRAEYVPIPGALADDIGEAAVKDYLRTPAAERMFGNLTEEQAMKLAKFELQKSRILANAEQQYVKRLGNVVVDPFIFKDPTGKVIDLRKVGFGLDDIAGAFERNFQIPIVGFNPAKLFFHSALRENRRMAPYQLLHFGTEHPELGWVKKVSGWEHAIDKAGNIKQQMLVLGQGHSKGGARLFNLETGAFMKPEEMPFGVGLNPVTNRFGPMRWIFDNIFFGKEITEDMAMMRGGKLNENPAIGKVFKMLDFNQNREPTGFFQRLIGHWKDPYKASNPNYIAKRLAEEAKAATEAGREIEVLNIVKDLRRTTGEPMGAKDVFGVVERILEKDATSMTGATRDKLSELLEWAKKGDNDLATYLHQVKGMPVKQATERAQVLGSAESVDALSKMLEVTHRIDGMEKPFSTYLRTDADALEHLFNIVRHGDAADIERDIYKLERQQNRFLLRYIEAAQRGGIPHFDKKQQYLFKQHFKFQKGTPVQDRLLQIHEAVKSREIQMPSKLKSQLEDALEKAGVGFTTTRDGAVVKVPARKVKLQREQRSDLWRLYRETMDQVGYDIKPFKAGYKEATREMQVKTAEEILAQRGADLAAGGGVVPTRSEKWRTSTFERFFQEGAIDPGGVADSMALRKQMKEQAVEELMSFQGRVEQRLMADSGLAPLSKNWMEATKEGQALIGRQEELINMLGAGKISQAEFLAARERLTGQVDEVLERIAQFDRMSLYSSSELDAHALASRWARTYETKIKAGKPETWGPLAPVEKVRPYSGDKYVEWAMPEERQILFESISHRIMNGPKSFDKRQIMREFADTYKNRPEMKDMIEDFIDFAEKEVGGEHMAMKDARKLVDRLTEQETKAAAIGGPESPLDYVSDAKQIAQNLAVMRGRRIQDLSEQILELERRKEQLEYAPLSKTMKMLRSQIDPTRPARIDVRPGLPSPFIPFLETDEEIVKTVGRAAREALNEYYVGSALSEIDNARRFIDQLGTVLTDVEVENMHRTFDLFNLRKVAGHGPAVRQKAFVDTYEEALKLFAPRTSQTVRTDSLMKVGVAGDPTFEQLMDVLEQKAKERGINLSEAFQKGRVSMRPVEEGVYEVVSTSTRDPVDVSEGFVNRLQASANKHFGKWYQKFPPYDEFADVYRRGLGENLMLQKSLFRFDPFDVTGSIKETWKNLSRLYSGQDEHGLATVIRKMWKQFSPDKWEGGKLTTDLDHLSTTMFWPTYLTQRLSRGLGEYGLGFSLSPDKLGTASRTYYNLFKYRVAPVVAGAGLLAYIDWESEKADDAFSLPDTPRVRLSRRLANIYVGLRLDIAKVFDTVGLTDEFKRIHEAYPGMDIAMESPPGMIAGALGFNVPQNEEELKEWYREGTEDVRRGRWWLLGNSPWGGGRITAQVPNWYRRGTSGYREDTLWGGSDEFWQHYWLPTPRYPLSPLKRLTDPYWWEKKHYADRPYPLTGGAFEETMPFGGILNATVGRIIKPYKVMHREELNARAAFLGGQRNRHPALEAALIELGTTPGPEQLGQGTTQGVRLIGPGGGGTGAVTPTYVGLLAGATPTGQAIPVMSEDHSAENQITAINTDDRRKMRRRMSRRLSYFHRKINPEEVIHPNDPYYRLGQIHYNITETAGIFGFASTFFTQDKYGYGDLGAQKPVAQRADRAYGAERWFWDQGIGGLGGGVSEIGRRFLPHRRRQILEYNPILNKMPSWMPGTTGVEQNYYIDFHKGDPFTKVAFGEARLPGPGYEKLHPTLRAYHGNYGIEQFRASSLGRDLKTTVASFLNLGREAHDYDPNGKGLGRLPYEGPGSPTYEGTKAHRRLQAQWAKEGSLIEAERFVFDPRTKVSGHIDAVVRMENGYNTVVEIKTKSAKAIKELEAPQQEHMSQVNFYLYSQGLPFGFIYYTARDKPDVTKVFKVHYDPERLQRDLETVEHARQIVSDWDRKGILNRPEFYSDVDKFKILADVAPYSQSFWAMRRRMFRDKEAIMQQGRWSEVERTLENHKRRIQKYRKTEYRYVGKPDPKDASAVERTLGWMWEKFAHMDTPFHTKFLQVRSATEQYERNYLYGNDFTDWGRPVSAILVPAYRGFARHNPVVSAGLGAALGSLFFKRGPYRIIGALIGGLVGGGMSVVSRFRARLRGRKAPIPDIREKEWELNEYFDMLEYVKFRGLYSRYKQALQYVGIDMDKMDPGRQHPQLPIVDYANEYKRRFKGTAYAADVWNQRQVMAAWPAQIREFYPIFANTRSEKERERIYNQTPDNLKRFLARAWATNSPRWMSEWRAVEARKPDLKRYFATHALPGPQWEGWNPNVNLDEYKYKVAKNEGINAKRIGLWDDVARAAEANRVRVLDWRNGSFKRNSLEHRLRAVLHGAGVRDADIKVDMQDYHENRIDLRLNMRRDFTGEIIGALHKEGYHKEIESAHEDSERLQQLNAPFELQ